ncbi:MAG: ATP-binding protein [Propionibacteriaceae bacterium]|jgi:hypothetical protein|nr:ATP-binding protein [Propionibacteriaceae bacterium]
MKELPLGIQTFAEVRDGYVYADKTGYVQQLAEDGKYFFLSRPRRFGKSLFVDTLNEAWEGNRELFEGLALAETDFSFEPHPVVRLDMSTVDISSPARLEEDLLSNLADRAAADGLVIEDKLVIGYFRSLILGLSRKYSKRVVVLIDEYDKPIIEYINDKPRAEANRAVLRGLYGVLKGLDAHLKFVFLTGVSKFTRLSLFSVLNNLTDITLVPDYANICGITEPEFDDLFSEHLAAALARGNSGEKSMAGLRQKVFDWYDGYSWDGKSSVFNPFSLLSFFQFGVFSPYWYSSGTPSFLMKTLKGRPRVFLDVQDEPISTLDLDSHEIEDAPPASLLFQTGFLTVKNVDYMMTPPVYQVGFPNLEVSTSFAKSFMLDGLGVPDADNRALKLVKSLMAGDAGALEDALAGLFASIPYNLHQGNEAYYHSLFLAFMQSIGLRVEGEAAVSGGEADGMLDMPTGHSYVIELKYSKDDEADLDALATKALNQIKAKGYADRYKGTDRSVHLIGVAASGKGNVKVVVGA